MISLRPNTNTPTPTMFLIFGVVRPVRQTIVFITFDISPFRSRHECSRWYWRIQEDLGGACAHFCPHFPFHTSFPIPLFSTSPHSIPNSIVSLINSHLIPPFLFPNSSPRLTIPLLISSFSPHSPTPLLNPRPHSTSLFFIYHLIPPFLSFSHIPLLIRPFYPHSSTLHLIGPFHSHSPQSVPHFSSQSPIPLPIHLLIPPLRSLFLIGDYIFVCNPKLSTKKTTWLAM